MGAEQERAKRPEDLSRFFVQRANAADVDGLVALYEPDALLVLPTGEVATGEEAIRSAYEQLARLQPDGTWLWILDQPNVLR